MKKWPKFSYFALKKNFQDMFFSEKTDLAFRLVNKPLEILPEKFWPKNKKWPKFYIFLSEKNFQDPFFSEKTDLAFPTSKAAPRNGARKKNCL